MNFALKTSLALVVGLATLAACKSSSNNGNGDDDDSSGSGLDIDSELAEKDFADLEEEDKVALCEALNKAQGSVDRSKTCAIIGASTGLAQDGDEDACTEAKEKCEDDEPEEVDCEKFAETDFSECEGSVQDYVDCINDQVAAASKIEAPECKDLADADEDDLTVDQPSSCKSFFKGCAALGGGATPTPGDDDDDTGDDDDTPPPPKADAAPPTGGGCIKCSGSVTCTSTAGNLMGTLSGTNSECKFTATTGLPEAVTLKCADNTVNASPGVVGEFTPESSTSANFDMTLSLEDGEVDFVCTQ